MYACDFETRNEEDNCSVWHWGYAEVGNIDNWNWGIDIESFMEWCSKINDTIYFHNLKFDGNFIVSWLLRNGFTHNNEKKHKERTFKTLINKMGVWYSIEICWSVKRNRKIVTKMYDSFKKLPFKLERIAIDLNLPLLKGKIDYNKERPIGYQPTEDEIAYLRNDVQILALAMEIQYEENLQKMTIGSDCLNTYKEMLGNGDVKKGEKKYRKLFPVLDKHIDKVIRESYRGGWCYVNPKYKNILLKCGIILDVNSEYPWAMRENLMPYGVPMYFKGEYVPNKIYPLFIQQLECSFEIKKDHLPMIQIKNKPLHFKGNEYLTSSKGLRVQLSLTSVDLQLFFDHYEVINPKFIGGFMFKGAYGLYSDYIDHFMNDKIKYKDVPSKKLKAKLLLNNLYGKMGTSIDVTSRIPMLDENEVVRLRVGEPEESDPQYVATAAFTTSYARNLIIRTSQANYDRFVYCDTDSMHLLGKEIPSEMIENNMIDKTALGKFDLEHTFVRAKYLFQKTYIYEAITYDKQGNETGTETIVKGAGMTDEVKKHLNFDNFEPGVKVPGLKKSKTVKGGVVITDKIFTLRERGIVV